METELLNEKDIANGLLHIKCAICETTFTQLSKLTSHLRNTHLSERSLDGLSDKTLAESPETIKQPDNEVLERLKKIFSCDLCKYYTNRSNLLKTHVENVHEKTLMACLSFGNNKSSMKGHNSSVQGKEKPFQCEQCDSSFSTQYHVKRHTESVHLKVKNFKCNATDACSFSSYASGDLRRHIDSVHQKIMDFPSAECSITFGTYRDLKTHAKDIHQ